MTNDELKAIEDRYRKMPQGSLVSCTCGHCGLAWHEGGSVCVASFTGPRDEEQPVPANIRDAYRDFFIHAVNDVPLLVATVRALQGDIARLNRDLWDVKDRPKLQEALSGKGLEKHL